MFIITACHKQNVENEYYKSGQLKSKIRIKDGVKDGESEYFSENGIINARYNYENGKKNGSYEIYHENGKVSKKGFYKNDKLEGEVMQFVNNGDTLLKQIYKDGEIEIDILYKQGRPVRKMDFGLGLMTIYNMKGTAVEIKKIK